MADTPVRILLPSGLGSLTLKLYPVDGSTLANGTGDTLTEDSTVKRRYDATVTEALSGDYEAVVETSSGGVVGGGFVKLADTTDLCIVDRLASQASVDELAGDGDSIDGHTTIGALKLMLAAMVGKLSGASGTSVAIRAADDSKTRITATVDAYGNRSAVTLDDT